MKNIYIAHKRTSDSSVQSLKEHLIETGELAEKFAKKIGLPNIGMALGLLHDFGKYSLEFQAYIKSATGEINFDQDDYVDAISLKGKIDHSSAGAQYAYKNLKTLDSSNKGELCAQIVAICIASHHSGLIDMLSPDRNKGKVFTTRMNKATEKTHFNQCQRNADPEILKKIDTLFKPELIKELLCFVKKIIPRPSQAFEKTTAFKLGFLTRFLFSCLIDADRLNSAEFEMPERLAMRKENSDLPDWPVAINRLEKFISKFRIENKIDQQRRLISEHCLQRASQPPGIFTLTVPTGGGKTYASLRYALHHANTHHLEKIFYVIPYTSIIEQNSLAMRKALEKPGDRRPWILEHHSNIDPETQTWHSKLVSENWDAPIVITTMVQFLETLFKGGTKSVRRLHQLSNSVIVFDEIQTLPISCVHLFCNAINFLVENCGSSTLLCTATQPLLDKLDNPKKGQLSMAPNHELMPNIPQLFDDFKRVKIENHCKIEEWSVDNVAKFSLKKYSEKSSCLVIVNTKKWAKNLFIACENAVESGSLFHLSTSQYPAHRKQLFATIRDRLEQGLPVLCISTQLIEAGVDIDFSCVIRALAGLDSIAQAAGRCNRHGKRSTATVYVINLKDEKVENLEAIKTGQEVSGRIFREQESDYLSPDVMARYFQYYFFNRKDKMDYPCKVNEGTSTTLLTLLSDHKGNPCSANIKPETNFPLLEQAFMEAGNLFQVIDAPTQGVIVEHGDARELIANLCAVAKDFEPAQYIELLKKAQAYSINVHSNVWRDLHEQGALQEIQPGESVYYLKEEFYSEHFGLSSKIVNNKSLLFC